MEIEHVSENCQCIGKKCTKCDALLCVGKFTKDKRLKSKLKSECRSCASAQNKKWRETNREYNSKRHEIYNEAHREHRTQSRLAWRKANPERDRATQERYRMKHPERVRARSRQYYRDNVDTLKEYHRRYRLTHYERILERDRQYYFLNRERIIEREKQYRLLNRERIKERGKQRHKSTYVPRPRPRGYVPRPRSKMSEEERRAKWRKYYYTKREYNIQRVLKWIKDNPVKHAARQAKRRALKIQSGGEYSPQEWEELKAKYDYTCLCCGKREPDIQLHADHVIPIIKGGSSYITNIQPLCKPCNSSKGRKILDFRT